MNHKFLETAKRKRGVESLNTLTIVLSIFLDNT